MRNCERSHEIVILRLFPDSVGFGSTRSNPSLKFQHVYVYIHIFFYIRNTLNETTKNNIFNNLTNAKCSNIFSTV